jgi:replicative DNA helicase
MDQNLLPPHDLDLERTLLGVLMLEPQSVTDVYHVLAPADLYSEAHHHIYEAIRALYVRGENIDFITVAADLRRREQLDMAGGQSALMQMTAAVGSTAHAQQYAYLLKALSVKRQLIAYGAHVSRSGYEEHTDFEEALGGAMTWLDSINNSITRLTERSYEQMVYDTVAEMREAAGSGYRTGLPCYISNVDTVTLGFQDSDLVIVAARPGMGKTAFIIQAAKRQAEQGIPVGIFSLEMSARQNIQRIIANEIRADISSIRRGGLVREQWQQLDRRMAAVAALPIQICDLGGMTINEIVAIAKRWKLKHGIRALYVDYMQLITLDRTHRNMNREQEISQISRRLKQLAKELDIPVIALSQLSRNVETRADRRPILSDLRDSGSIEQDADMVMFLYRPEYYKIKDDPEYGSTEGLCEVIISKFRNGRPCTILTEFHPEYFEFGDFERR